MFLCKITLRVRLYFPYVAYSSRHLVISVAKQSIRRRHRKCFRILIARHSDVLTLDNGVIYSLQSISASSSISKNMAYKICIRGPIGHAICFKFVGIKGTFWPTGW